MHVLARHRGDRRKDLVGFLVGEVHYAIDIHRVREIIRPLSFVTLPHAPETIIGVADHRGEVVPVLDLRRRFGLSSLVTHRSKWIVIRLGLRSVALAVDMVTAVFGADLAQRRAVPRLGPGDPILGISAVYAHEGSLVFVLDVEKVSEPAAIVDIRAAKELMAELEGAEP